MSQPTVGNLPVAAPPALTAAPTQLVVFEDGLWSRFLPLILTRAVFDLRVGARTLISRVQTLSTNQHPSESVTISSRVNAWCRPSLAAVVARSAGPEVNGPLQEDTLLLNGRGVWRALPPARHRGSWVGIAGREGRVACLFAAAGFAAQLTPDDLLGPGDAAGGIFAALPRRDVSECVELLDWPWDLVRKNRQLLVTDLRIEPSSVVSDSDDRHEEGVSLLNRSQVRIGEGGRIWPANVIDAGDGPVWIGERVRILPHCFIQGPAFIGDDCLLQAGTVIRGGTTLGPHCKVGGEIEGSVFQGYSNKQHSGFLGHSFVGSWVNLGAGCANSDLKHTYGTVRVPVNGTDVETGEMFVGALIGDHAKIGINCAIPTGASVGFASAVNGARCPKFVPSFAWIDEGRLDRYEPARALVVAERMMARRQQSLSDAEQASFLASAAIARQWERWTG